MTPANSDTPLRRSEVSRTAAASVTINDDEAERREERRLSIVHATANDTSTIEDNETLKKCLELYNGNKLSRENAWSLSLIDTLSSVLQRHHRTLNNFKMAGSSLEASSKVYGLRVDSIHIDVLRMAAGLNAKKFSEKNLDLDLGNDNDDNDDDDGVATGGEGGADPNASAAGVDTANSQKSPPKKKKKQRKAVCTITKNKETLNARMDTVPLQDPVFAKLNSTVGSINSSNRLMNNILLTTNSELRLRTNFPVFDDSILPEQDYTAEVPSTIFENDHEKYEIVPSEKILKFLPRIEKLQLRPLHSGYIISDTPVELPDEPYDDNENVGTSEADDFAEAHQSMAFDINAECEPLPESREIAAIVDVDYAEFEDLSVAERSAINRCRGIQRQPVIIDDLRPVDSFSQLEYSYRPMEKISRFWAGPAHWKFKRARISSLAHSALGGENNGTHAGNTCGVRQRSHAQAAALLAKKRQKQLDFIEVHEDLFLKLDDNFKRRRVNIHKKWDNRKLKLPTDLRLNPKKFFQYQMANGLRITVDTTIDASHEQIGGSDFDDIHDDLTTHHDVSGDNIVNGMNVDGTLMPDDNNKEMDGDDFCNDINDMQDNDAAESTILEIPNEFTDAPTMVQKIIVPFAKRAKVIDMKSLKKSCAHLINKQLRFTLEISTLPPQNECHKNEKYADGVASFHDTYKHLPELLSHTMAESLSPAIAIYSVLHLANDLGLRLIQQDDLQDFKIRKISN